MSLGGLEPGGMALPVVRADWSWEQGVGALDIRHNAELRYWFAMRQTRIGPGWATIRRWACARRAPRGVPSERSIPTLSGWVTTRLRSRKCRPDAMRVLT